MITDSRARLNSLGLTWLLCIAALLLAVIAGGFTALFEGDSYILVPGLLILFAATLISAWHERWPFYLLVVATPLQHILDGLGVDLGITLFLLTPNVLCDERHFVELGLVWMQFSVTSGRQS